MKHLCLLVLAFSLTQIGQAQSLSLNDLLHLNEMSMLDMDIYLVSHGWKLSEKQKQDSSFTVTWAYPTNGQSTALINHTRKEGKRPITRYNTFNRTSFVLMQHQVLSYNMTILGEDMDRDGLATGYRGQKYEIWLEVHPPTDSITTWYTTQVQQHGLVEGISIDNSGKQERIWLRQGVDGKGGTLVGYPMQSTDNTPKEYFFPVENLPKNSFSASERSKMDSTLRNLELRTRPTLKVHSKKTLHHK